MTRRSYLAFGDIEGKLAMLRVECTRCSRSGRYSVAKLIETYGRDGNMTEWTWQLTLVSWPRRGGRRRP
jgi:hypothetical protein